MSKDSQLHGTVVHQLPSDVSLRDIQAHVGLRTGLDKAWGETYLLVHKNELMVLTRGSVFDEYDRIRTPPKHIPRLEKSATQAYLFVATDNGGEHRLVVTSTELPEVERLLRTLKSIVG